MKPRRLQRLTSVSRTSGGIALAKGVWRPMLYLQFRYWTVNIQRLPPVHRDNLRIKKASHGFSRMNNRIFTEKVPQV